MHMYRASTWPRGQCVRLTPRTNSTCKLTTANMLAPLLAGADQEHKCKMTMTNVLAPLLVRCGSITPMSRLNRIAACKQFTDLPRSLKVVNG